MADGDRIDTIARQLYEAFLLDTNREGEPWPPKPTAHAAWRRAAAAAIDATRIVHLPDPRRCAGRTGANL